MDPDGRLESKNCEMTKEPWLSLKDGLLFRLLRLLPGVWYGYACCLYISLASSCGIRQSWYTTPCIA